MCTSSVAPGTGCRFFMALISSGPQACYLSIKTSFYCLNVVWTKVSDGIDCLGSCDQSFLHEELVILIRFCEWIHSSLLQHPSLIRMWVECNFLKTLLVNLIHPHSDSGFARIYKVFLVADWLRASLSNVVFFFFFCFLKSGSTCRLRSPSSCEWYTPRSPQTFVNLHLCCDSFDIYTQLE